MVQDRRAGRNAWRKRLQRHHAPTPGTFFPCTGQGVEGAPPPSGGSGATATELRHEWMPRARSRVRSGPHKAGSVAPSLVNRKLTEGTLHSKANRPGPAGNRLKTRRQAVLTGRSGLFAWQSRRCAYAHNACCSLTALLWPPTIATRVTDTADGLFRLRSLSDPEFRQFLDRITQRPAL